MPNCQKMLKEIPVFWMKDDHDHRYNDCDTTAGRLPGNKLGLEVFSEQLPYPKYPVDKPYRTYRLNKHLQIWMLEGRDYRSPNNLPDNHKKSIWGEEQLKWLKKTMLESDATFKLLVSPTPMIGPDDAYKSDNHCNTGGFITERDNFFDWLEDNNVDESGFYIICGDRHWQYHSIHPTGIEEFSCGAMIDENSRLGRKPGDPKSNDPLSLIEQKYTQKNAGGGFLEVIQFNHYEQPTLKFVFHDTKGKVLYQVKYKKK